MLETPDCIPGVSFAAQAKDVELGQEVLLDGSWKRITGWFWHSRSGIVLEYEGRYHRHPSTERMEVRWPL